MIIIYYGFSPQFGKVTAQSLQAVPPTRSGACLCSGRSCSGSSGHRGWELTVPPIGALAHLILDPAELASWQVVAVHVASRHAVTGAVRSERHHFLGQDLHALDLKKADIEGSSS